LEWQVSGNPTLVLALGSRALATEKSFSFVYHSSDQVASTGGRGVWAVTRGDGFTSGTHQRSCTTTAFTNGRLREAARRAVAAPKL